LSVSVFSFHCYFQVPYFPLKAFPKISCTWNTTDRDLYSKWYMPTANCISSSAVWYNKDLPLLPVTELHLMLLKKYLLLNPNSTNNTKIASCQQNMFMSYWLVSTPQKFPAHNNITLIKIRAYKIVCMGKWIHSSESSFYLEFLAWKCNKYKFCGTI
jgi:hypothetical protein